MALPLTKRGAIPLTNFGQGLALLARPSYPLPVGERRGRETSSPPRGEDSKPA